MLSFGKSSKSPVTIASGAAVGATVTAGGSVSDISAGGFLIPAGTMGLNGQVSVKLDLSSSGTVGTRTIGVYLSDGTGGAVKINEHQMASTQVSMEIRICNRASVSSQRCKLHSQYSLSAGTVFAAAAENSDVDMYITVAVTNPSDSVTLESYAVELTR